MIGACLGFVVRFAGASLGPCDDSLCAVELTVASWIVASVVLVAIETTAAIAYVIEAERRGGHGPRVAFGALMLIAGMFLGCFEALVLTRSS